MVRCKFVCQSKREYLNSYTGGGSNGSRKLYEYAFSAVFDGSPENKKFWEWTPQGRLEVSTVKDDSFEPGKEYYLDISIAEGQA